MTSLLQDVRHGLCMLRKSPGFTSVALLTVALGTGANTAIFSLVDAVMLRSAPVSDPDRLLLLEWFARREPNVSGYSSFGDCGGAVGPSSQSGCSFSYPMFKEIRAKANSFSDVAAFAGPADLNLTGNGIASVAGAELVSGDYFKTLGVGAARGRTLDLADEAPGAEPVVVLSHAYWKSAFGGAVSAVGKTIWLNNIPFAIVGIAEPAFTHMTPGKRQDMWLPLTLGPQLGVVWSDPENAASWWLAVLARPKQDTLPAQTQAAVSLVFRNALLYDAKPLAKDADNPGIALVPAQQGLTGIRSIVGPPLYLLTAMVGVVLLIACVNVSGLMLARATTREREMAVRFALGAARTRIIRQLLTESLILAVLGGTLGVIVAFWGAQALTAFVSNNWPWPLQLDVHLDARVLIFTGSMSMLAGILLGVVPAFRSTRGDLVSALKKNSGDGSAISGGVAGRFKIGDSLVVGQVALSVLVLVVSTLLLRTLANLKSIDPGFDTRQVLIFGIDPTSAGYKESRIRSLYRDLQARLANIPGVISASYSSEVLLSDGLSTADIHLEGQSDKSTVETEIMAVGPGFFETMRIRLLAGRGLGQSDVASARPVAVVNQAFANRFFTDRTPVGLHVRRKAGDEQIESEIVGVVADTKYDQLRKQVEPTLYMPVEGGRAYFELRAASNPAALIPAVRQAVSGLDNNLPLLNVRTQSETVDRLLFNERLIARLSALFAALALVLVCIGIYGLLSYEVSRRTREIGIRSALGAHPSDVLRLVVGQGIVLVLAGTGIGIAASFGITRYLQSMLYEVRPSDPLTFAVTSLFLIVVALLACYVPARRAANVDPMVALRYE